MLKHPDWTPSVRARLNALIQGPLHPMDYAVFDWDNTSIFGDIQDAATWELTQSHGLKLAPKTLAQRLLHDLEVPPNTPLSRHVESMNNAYERLWEIRFDSSQQREQWSRFGLGFYSLYNWVDETKGHDFAVLWVLRLLEGFSPKEITDVVQRALKKQRDMPLEPQVLHWEDQRLEVFVGVRPLEPMQELYQVLREHGVKTYVCTASCADVVAACAMMPRYGVPNRQDVLGMELGLDGSGLYEGSLAKGAVATQGEGKFDRIEKDLVPVHQRGPLIVAGDSNGDVAMLTRFESTACSLLIKRPGQKGPIQKTVERAEGTRFIVQFRDEKRGCFSSAATL